MQDYLGHRDRDPKHTADYTRLDIGSKVSGGGPLRDAR
jgi:hypothetical protein